MNGKSFEALLNGYLKNELTQEEEAHFLKMVQQESYDQQFKNAIDKLFEDNSLQNLADQSRGDVIFQNIMDTATVQDAEQQTKRVRLQSFGNRNLVKIAAAASVIGLLFAGTYFWWNMESGRQLTQTAAQDKRYKNDVSPGGEKATLILADGSIIVLDEVKDGALAEQGKTKVFKVGSKLAYDQARTGPKEILYNTLNTPRGGQYHVELPDGSHVWLNATSSLRFPTAFVGKERKVEITGEAYFEVSKNKDMPFVVSAKGAEVRVLGTHFNMMAYDEEATIKTTLLEGSVKFESGSSSSLLKPGQQSQLLKTGQLKVINVVDIGEVMAWKNGMFNFEGVDIETVMRQLARWYDVDVVYNQKVNPLFYLEMPRNSMLSDVLKVLELTGGVSFQIEGRKLLVKDKQMQSERIKK
jgi:transmembrane sensor